MKQHRDGKKIINWHRPLGPAEFKRKYLRTRFEDAETAVESWQPDDDSCDNSNCYDDYWDWADTSDGLDYVLDEARFAIHSALRSTAPLIPPRSASGYAPNTIGDQPFSFRRVAGDTAEPQPLTPRLVSYVAEFKRHPDGGTWPDPEFVSLLEEACRMGRDQLALLCRQVKTVSPELEASLGLIFAFAPFWIRHPGMWRPGDTEKEQLLSSFVHHLFVQHPVPRFLESNWSRPSGCAHAITGVSKHMTLYRSAA